MPVWFLVALAALHLGALIAFAYQKDAGNAVIMLGGMLVQIGLILKA